MLEKEIKKRVKQLLKDYEIWYFMPQNFGMGVSGVPDFICCLDGKFLALETKSSVGRLSLLQKETLKKLHSLGAYTAVVWPDGLTHLETLIQQIKFGGRLNHYIWEIKGIVTPLGD